jgi:hypothetical protein
MNASQVVLLDTICNGAQNLVIVLLFSMKRFSARIECFFGCGIAMEFSGVSGGVAN